jgi:hypothetical protein
MGLDMYAFASTIQPASPVDFDIPPDALLCQWRKHPNLHGWMEKLYRAKGGREENFTVTTVQLTLDDLDQLEFDVKNKRLPHTDGFFFGVSQAQHDIETLAFIERARAAIGDGKTVYYYPWW